MATIRVQPEPFDTGAELARLTEGRIDIGGIGCFVGVVRGGGISEMTLEHYPGMTERAIAAIAAEAERRWSLLGCTVIHRVGRLLPGDPIVLVLARQRAPPGGAGRDGVSDRLAEDPGAVLEAGTHRRRRPLGGGPRRG